jgi:stage IV sporulation protein B
MVFTAVFGWCYMEKTVPRHISIVVHEQEDFSFALPFDVTLTSDSEEVVLQNQSSIPSDQIRLKMDEPFSLRSDKQGNYHLGLKLFGTITLRDIQLDVVDTRYAVPCGVPVGIYLKSRGIMVIGTGRIKDSEGQEVEPAYGILQSGDYIEAINGKPLRDKEALITDLNRSEGEKTVLKVRRNGEEMEIAMNPVEAEDGNYKLGAWVRDDTQGIGTLTYLEEDGSFGALGHGISDSDTGRVVEIQNGSLYETEILGIEKGSAGDPGVMAGVIFYGPGSYLGTIEANTEVGIFGSVNEKMKKSLSSESMEVGLRQDVHKGPALIRSSVSGTVKDYEIEIQRIEQNPFQKNKSLIIHITDPELIALTGGIIQGMSGSPIIQDGKLIGAVTHVFVQDASRGYGILIEDMMEYDK